MATHRCVTGNGGVLSVEDNVTRSLLSGYRELAKIPMRNDSEVVINLVSCNYRVKHSYSRNRFLKFSKTSLLIGMGSTLSLITNTET